MGAHKRDPHIGRCDDCKRETTVRFVHRLWGNKGPMGYLCRACFRYRMNAFRWAACVDMKTGKTIGSHDLTRMLDEHWEKDKHHIWTAVLP